MKQNDIIRLKTPESVQRTGTPDCMLIVKNGVEYRFEWGRDYRVSSSCDPDNQIANLDYKGDYPLVNKNFALQLKEQFKLIKQESDE